MLQWEKIDAEEWNSIVPPKKATKWDALLAEIEKGSIIKVPVDASEKRGYRIGIARAAKSRGYKVEFREYDGFLALRVSTAALADTPAQTTKALPVESGKVKGRGRPRKTEAQEK